LFQRKNIQIIKWLFLVMIMVFCNGTTALALDYIGAPMPDLDPDHFKLGAYFSTSSIDLDLNGGTGYVLENGVRAGGGTVGDVKLKDFKATNIKAEIGYGIDYSWELFLRMGASNLDFESDDLGENFDGSSTPSIGGGVKVALYEQYDFRLGILGQVNWAKYSGKTELAGELPVIQLDMMDIQVVLGAEFMLAEDVWVYGGPFYNMIKGSVDHQTDEISTNNSLYSYDFTWDIEPASSIGAFVGIQYMFDTNSYLTAECQVGSGGTLFGAGVAFKF
jgi:hypothetical protein